MNYGWDCPRIRGDFDEVGVMCGGFTNQDG